MASNLSIRFVDGCTPQEKFHGFYQCTSGNKSEDIACDIIASLPPGILTLNFFEAKHLMEQVLWQEYREE